MFCATRSPSSNRWKACHSIASDAPDALSSSLTILSAIPPQAASLGVTQTRQTEATTIIREPDFQRAVRAALAPRIAALGACLSSLRRARQGRQQPRLQDTK